MKAKPAPKTYDVTISNPVSVTLNDTDAVRWFRDGTDTDGVRPGLFRLSITEMELLARACAIVARTPEAFVHEAVLKEARRVVKASFSTKGRGLLGSRDADLLRAYNDLVKHGEDPKSISPSRLRGAAGVTNYRTVRAWLERRGLGVFAPDSAPADEARDAAGVAPSRKQPKGGGAGRRRG